jgi:stress response protein YsnF
MSYEKVVTLFDTAEHAEYARKNLEKAGFSADDISIVGKKGLADNVIALREPGLWHRLFGRDIAEYEARVYGKTVEAGGAVLTLRVADTQLAKAMGILNQHHIVDVSRRAVDTGMIASSEAFPATVPAPAKPLTTEIDKGEVLRLAEEQLEIGKRLVTEGTTRIRRFFVEKPVEAKVTLHEEHVEIVRLAAADPSSIKDVDWSEKTIELVDTHEEPVVSKSVHMAEEVRVGKKATDRVETVRDKVRRQDVEVERTPVGGRH